MHSFWRFGLVVLMLVFAGCAPRAAVSLPSQSYDQEAKKQIADLLRGKTIRPMLPSEPIICGAPLSQDDCLNVLKAFQSGEGYEVIAPYHTSASRKDAVFQATLSSCKLADEGMLDEHDPRWGVLWDALHPEGDIRTFGQADSLAVVFDKAPFVPFGPFNLYALPGGALGDPERLIVRASGYRTQTIPERYPWHEYYAFRSRGQCEEVLRVSATNDGFSLKRAFARWDGVVKIGVRYFIADVYQSGGFTSPYRFMLLYLVPSAAEWESKKTIASRFVLSINFQ